MYSDPSHHIAHRVLAKISSIASTVWTALCYPTKFRSADIHILLQSEAQKQAQRERQKSLACQERQQRVLVIIPFRDKWELTATCIKTLAAQDLAPHHFLVALVDNGSVEGSTRQGIQKFLKQSTSTIQFRHLRYDMPFNFSTLNNRAVKDCADFQPDIIFLCNNDIEFVVPDSARRLVDFTRDQDNGGAIGCTLVYPNQRIQHLFVFVGSKIVGSHPYKGRRLNLQETWFQHPRPVSAVTGAITLMKADHFRKSGGFDEDLPTSYQDVDLCLKFQSLGLINWVVPDIVLIHHETQTRKREPSWSEAEYMYKKWGDTIRNNAFVHPSLNRNSEHYVLKTWTRLKCQNPG